MGWWTDWLDSRPDAEAAADNSRSKKGASPYQASLIPGDIGYLCNGCGRDLKGGLFGMGHCKC